MLLLQLDQVFRGGFSADMQQVCLVELVALSCKTDMISLELDIWKLRISKTKYKYQNNSKSTQVTSVVMYVNKSLIAILKAKVVVTKKASIEVGSANPKLYYS